MRKSQLIALVILLVVVSVLIWIGAFSDNKNDGDTILTASPTIAASVEPLGTPSASGGAAASTDAPAPPAATQAPTAAVFPAINAAEFSNLNNSFTYWYSYFRAGDDGKQNVPYFEDGLKQNIGDVKYIFLKDDSESQFEVYLTFIANYENGYTGQILDTLKNNNIKATFFVSAEYIKGQPALVRRMRDEGHLIGTRGPLGEAVANYSVDEFVNAMMEVEEAYQALFGENERMSYYRPDFFSARTLAVAEKMGYNIVFRTFSTDTNEWYGFTAADARRAAERLYERLYDGAVPELGLIEIVKEALPTLINEAADINVTFKRLDS